MIYDRYWKQITLSDRGLIINTQFEKVYFRHPDSGKACGSWTSTNMFKLKILDVIYYADSCQKSVVISELKSHQ